MTVRDDHTDGRAVSPVFGYALTLGITTVLIAGLLIAAGGFVDTQRQATTESELEVIGHQLAADVAAADRLARTDGTETVAVTRGLPNRVVGSSYTVHVRDDENGPTRPYLELTSTQPEVSVTVGLLSQTDVDPSSVGGGKIVVTYENGALVIQSG